MTPNEIETEVNNLIKWFQEKIDSGLIKPMLSMEDFGKAYHQGRRDNLDGKECERCFGDYVGLAEAYKCGYLHKQWELEGGEFEYLHTKELI